MKLTKVDSKLSVTGQPSLSDIAGLGSRGVTTLINNRPDGEAPGQPGGEAEQAAAAACGLGYSELPVTATAIRRVDIERFREAVAAAPGPVVAHCGGGTRSLTLHVLGEVLHGAMRREDVLPFGAALGFDLTGAVAWLNAHGPESGGSTAQGETEEAKL